MLTNSELNTLKLSPTNKDYYQVWTELLDTASKLSERWDPSSTNESDPGIVLLKVLTAVADKLNYNIDKNILEAFMPTAAQEDSMRRLCDMLGYSIKYYQSATTKVTIRYSGDTTDLSEENEEKLPLGGLAIPAFTAITTTEKDLYYITTTDTLLTNDNTTVQVDCIEGQLIQCEIGNNKIITMDNLDDNFRFYLPETRIAENGLFVYNTSNGYRQGYSWKKVDNLNTIASATKAYVFGYDTREGRPYLQFPSDVSFLIEDGFEIFYIRTNGAAGNISAQMLTTLEKPTTDDWTPYADSEFFYVTNPDAALNGRNPETIDQAYQGFKKTIGTFDTLVTCRDYMNKIYQLVDDQNNKLVSNILVSDIRDDINRAHTLCSFSDYGIIYVEKANAATETTPELEHFDLVLYPFKTYRNLHTQADYEGSFRYSDTNLSFIQTKLKDSKTISHNYINPKDDEIVCIKNYLKLNAKISTINKVNYAEEALILADIYKALFARFNMHELDFGEEIPYEAIVECIETANTKIKSVMLEEPILYTRFATADGSEYSVASTATGLAGKALYNKLALRNILAGRIELFNYDTNFINELGEAAYTGFGTYNDVTQITTSCTLKANEYLRSNEILKLRAPNFKTITPYAAYINYFLKLNTSSQNTVVPARFISLQNIWFKRITPDTPASKDSPYPPYFATMFFKAAIAGKYIVENSQGIDSTVDNAILCTRYYADDDKDTNVTAEVISTVVQQRGCWYVPAPGGDVDADPPELSADDVFTYEFITTPRNTYRAGYYYYAPLRNSDETFAVLNATIKLINEYKPADPEKPADRYWSHVKGFYKMLAPDLSRAPGYLINEDKYKFVLCKTTLKGGNASAFNTYYIPDPWNGTDNHELLATGWDDAVSGEDGVSRTPLGISAELDHIQAGEEYQLKTDEYLFINYTPASTTDSSEQTASAASALPINKVYGPGTIIKPNDATTLYDSNEMHNLMGTAWRKVSGFDFTKYATTVDPFDGMYSLGPNEQIDIRDFVEVNLNDNIMYLYWILNKDREINIDPEANSGVKSQAFTLEDGEYIFYTDKNKLEMSYYGSGTEVIFISEYKTKFIFNKDNTRVNFEKIITDGLAAIPWRAFNFTADKYFIKLREYKYIVLGEGDRLIIGDSTDTYDSDSWKALTNQESVKYEIAGAESTLPKIRVKRSKTEQALGEDAGADICWEVKSCLELSTGPDKAQILHPDNKIMVSYSNGGTTDTVEITPDPNEVGELAIKTNIPCQFAGGTIPADQITSNYNMTLSLKAIADRPVSTVVSTAELDSITLSDMTKVKRFKSEIAIDAPITIDGSCFSNKLALYNFNTMWTLVNNDQFSIKQGGVQQNPLNPYYSYISAPTVVPAGHYNIMMVYYLPPDGLMLSANHDIGGTMHTTIFDGAGFRFKPTPTSDGVDNVDEVGADTTGSRVKIFNNLQNENYLANLLSATLNESFENYFAALKWWDYQDVSTTLPESAYTAFGAKQLYTEITDPENPVNIQATFIDNVYYLRPGINILVYKESGTFEFFTDASGNSSLFLGNVDSINVPAHSFGLNVALLDYQYLGSVAADNETLPYYKEIQLLHDIYKTDKQKEFYYNCPLQAASAIDINTLLADDDAEKLSSAKFWYDVNNINNKFVISQIDAEYLKTGITIAKASKLR